jgi:hypothetical protein
MNVSARRFLLITALLATASSAQAAAVNFTMVINPGNTFDIYANATLGDNAGIASYGIPLTGNILSFDHKSPVAAFALQGAQSGPVGFSLLRSADNVITPSILASQDTITPTPFITYGFGQTGGDISLGGARILFSAESPVYNAKLLIGSGTYSGATPGFNVNSIELFSNVFINKLSAATQAAFVTTQVIPIPEPSSWVLLGLGMSVAVLWRKRSAR